MNSWNGLHFDDGTRQDRPMYGQYLSAVVYRALQPTVRVTDALQILAASAMPAAAEATGLPVPETNSVLAYIGAAALSFIALRLLFVAPYQVWRQQVVDISGLKVALNKPERIELARIAKIRAKKRIELSAVIRRMHWTAFGGDKSAKMKALNDFFIEAVVLMGEAGMPQAFDEALNRLASICKFNIENKGEAGKQGAQIFLLVDLMTDFLHGKITAEALALKMPPDIENQK